MGELKDNERKLKQTEKQKAAEMLANPEIKTNKEIYESLNISEATFYRWKNEQEFIDMVNKKVDKYTDKALPDVWKALIKEAADGNTQAIKLYFEMKNEYRDRKEITGKDGEPVKFQNMSDEKLLEEAEKYGIEVE